MLSGELKAAASKLQKEQAQRTEKERQRLEKERILAERQRQRQQQREEEARAKRLEAAAAAAAVRDYCQSASSHGNLYAAGTAGGGTGCKGCMLACKGYFAARSSLVALQSIRQTSTCVPGHLGIQHLLCMVTLHVCRKKSATSET